MERAVDRATTSSRSSRAAPICLRVFRNKEGLMVPKQFPSLVQKSYCKPNLYGSDPYSCGLKKVSMKSGGRRPPHMAQYANMSIDHVVDPVGVIDNMRLNLKEQHLASLPVVLSPERASSPSNTFFKATTIADPRAAQKRREKMISSDGPADLPKHTWALPVRH
jgi:hypothetical protein